MVTRQNSISGGEKYELVFMVGTGVYWVRGYACVGS